MSANPFLGVVFHALGGLAAGSFYIPFKRVHGWAWESYWLAGGLFAWLIGPWVAAFFFCPDLLAVWHAAPWRSLGWTYFFGVLWGIGGLTFGLSMRYLGLSLGYALALGFCAAFGTVIPPAVNGELIPMALSLSGSITLAGVLVCLGGIAICARAGRAKDRELSAGAKQAVIREFNLVKGTWVAVFAGAMSACMAFGIAAGKPIAALAVEHGTLPLWQNIPVFVVVLAGGLSVNLVSCLVLNLRNRTAHDYYAGGGGWLVANYLFCALAGITWYLQFFFYGMGTTQMGRYDFSSWSIHMALIIVFSTVWGILLSEWKGASQRTLSIVSAGLAVLIASTLVIGLGNWVASKSQ